MKREEFYDWTSRETYLMKLKLWAFVNITTHTLTPLIKRHIFTFIKTNNHYRYLFFIKFDQLSSYQYYYVHAVIK
jgi:hypothetical protein